MVVIVVKIVFGQLVQSHRTVSTVRYYPYLFLETTCMVRLNYNLTLLFYMDSQSKLYVIGIGLVIGAWVTLSALMFGN